MGNNLEEIKILCICDNHYIVLLAALIKSIEQNHHSGEPIEFIIVDDQITESNRKKLTSSFTNKDIKFRWIPIKNCISKTVKLPTDKSSLPLNIYVRLLIQDFIPQDIKRLIYMDVDMIVLDDISKIWHVDFQSKTVAAVQDQFIQIAERWGGIANYTDFGLKADSKYFNAGLIVIDMEQWRQKDISNKVLDCLHEHREHALYQDQYGLNAILGNDWVELDPLWNRFAYSEEDKPYLIHFTGRKPIYKTYNYRKDYQEKFFFYLRQTQWKNFKPIGETRRYLKKAVNLMEKFRNILSKKMNNNN